MRLNGEVQMPTKTLLTIEQFDQLPEKEGVLYELNDGEVVTMTVPIPRHNRVRDRIARLMAIFVEEHKLGEVFSETGYQLAPETVRVPDVSFMRADRSSQIDPDRYIQGAPTLAIEVVSPNDTVMELKRKVKQYLAAGCTAVWVVNPEFLEVEVFRSDGSRFVRSRHETLEDAEVLPGFSLDLKTVFKGLE
jgi:Uma2 family endonuclease